MVSNSSQKREWVSARCESSDDNAEVADHCECNGQNDD